jgi:hypothetical protein
MKQLIKSLFIVFAMLVGLAIAVPCSCAGLILYQTDFEPPTFSPGVLVGQDGWTAPPPPPASPFSSNAAVISTTEPRLGTQSVLVPGADLIHQDFITNVTGGYYDAIGSYRKPVNYDTAGTQTVRVG